MFLRSFVLMAVLTIGGTPAFGRVWRDYLGKEVEADFLRMHEGRVILKQKGRVIPIPFDQLSERDQEYLRTRLEDEGQGHLLPAPQVQQTAPGVAGGVQPGSAILLNPPAASGSPGPAAGSRPPRFRFRQPVITMPTVPPPTVASVPQTTAPSPVPLTAPAPLDFPSNSSGTRPGGSSPSAQRFGAPGSSRPLYPSGQSVMVYQCTKCRREVPSTVHAGDHCPHCGAYFQYEETAGGGRTYAKWGARGSIGVVIALVIGLFSWLKNRAE